MSAPPATDRGPAALLAEKCASAAPGILTAITGKLRRLICVDEGLVVYAASNMIEEQFDEFLVRRKILSAGERAVAKLEAAKADKKIAVHLTEGGRLPPDVLREAFEDHVRALVSAVLGDPRAELAFALGRPNVEDDLTVRLSCVDLVVAHTRTHPKTLDEVRVRIGPPDMRPELTPRASRLLHETNLHGAAKFLVDHSDGETDIIGLAEVCAAPRSEMLRALYGLLLIGVLEPSKTTETRKAEMEKATREETLARLKSAESASYYDILGVSATATDAEVRHGYYLLARRFHPDRFRSGPLADLLDRVEAYFTQVTEAYNTLYDEQLRARYDEDLVAMAGKDEKELDRDKDSSALARQNYVAAKALLEKNRYQDAVKFLRNAVQLDGTRAPYFLELGRALGSNPRHRKEAEEHLLRATELDPALYDGYLALGEIYRKADRLDEAAQMFREVLRWDPGNLAAEEHLGEMGGGGGRRGGLFGG